MKYQIEDNVPIPSSINNSRQFGLPATLKRLDVSQSVLIPGKTATQQVSYAIQKAKVGRDVDFYSSVVDGGVRIWRTK